MGIWIARPALSGSEAAMWQRLASWAQSARRDVGGRLYLTTTMTSITSATRTRSPGTSPEALRRPAPRRDPAPLLYRRNPAPRIPPSL